MNPSIPQIPDLASILHTLATHTPQQPIAPEEKSDLEEGEYDPAEFNPIEPAAKAVPHINPQEQTRTLPGLLNITESRAKKVVPSASGITTWPKALSYTIQYIFPDPNKKRRIEHLIHTQRSHERQWWASRKELIRKAQGRDKSRAELDSVLASVGGLVATSSRLQGEAEGDELTKELAVFDRKVHYACCQMVDASNRELGELGIPFFCAGISDKVERTEMQSLKKKMLELLEDYCGSESSEE